MAKAILLIALLLYVLWAMGWRWTGRRGTNNKATKPPAPEKMVTCAYCRLNIPEREAILAQGRVYCCDEHSQLDTSGHP